MRVLKAAAIYFLIVFAAGFVLGLIRVPFLVPRLGARISELLEIPLMLAVVSWAARRIAVRNSDLPRNRFLVVGLVGLFFMLAAEFSLAAAISGQSALEYAAARDAVSGIAYAFALLFFAAAPYVFFPSAAQQSVAADAASRRG